jgi:hypothetical protein
MTSETRWPDAIVSRFPPRPTLATGEAVDRVWASTGASRDEVTVVLDLLELEYGIAPGFFRPGDSLDWLLEMVNDGGFWSRATNEIRAGDRQLELGFYLERRCKAHGIAMPRGLTALGQYVRACSGLAAT